MSREAREWVWDCEEIRDPAHVLILLTMAEVADRHGYNSYQSVATLAKDARVSTRTVQRHLRELEALGFIERTAEQQGRRPAVYRFTALDSGGENDPNGPPPRSPRGDKMTPLAATEEPARGDTGATQGRHSCDTQERSKEEELEPPCGGSLTLGLENTSPVERAGTPKPSKPGTSARGNGNPPRPARHETPLERTIQALTVKAFERPVKPSLQGGGNAFPAVRNLVGAALRAGWPVAEVEAVVTGDTPVVWTTRGLTTALEANRRTEVLPSMAPPGRPLERPPEPPPEVEDMTLREFQAHCRGLTAMEREQQEESRRVGLAERIGRETGTDPRADPRRWWWDQTVLEWVRR